MYAQPDLWNFTRYRNSDLDWLYAVQRGGDFQLPRGLACHRFQSELGGTHRHWASSFYGRRVYREALAHRLYAFCADPQDQLKAHFRFVTVQLADWVTYERAFHFDRQAAVRTVRNLLQGLNFLAILEFVTITNVRHSGRAGRLVCPHFHCIVWADRQAVLRDQLRRARRRCVGGSGLSPAPAGVHVRHLHTPHDVARVAVYSLKSPAYGNYVTRARGRYTQRDTRVPYIAHYRMYEILRQYRIHELVFAGGGGVSLRRTLS